jgi:AcrR family transcriptional regulator
MSSLPDNEISRTPSARKILDAASALFYEHGIHAVGVDVIAAKAGVTKKTLYDRFGSKERLVVEYLRQRDARWRVELAAVMDINDSPTEQLLSIFVASERWMKANSHKGCSFVNAHAEISDPEHPAYPILVGQKTWMTELFTRLVTRIGIARPTSTARTIMLLHEGALVAYGMGTFPHPIAHARRAARQLLTADHSQ